MQPVTRYAAVDFETFYDKEYSLRKMSTWAYVYHEKFDAYLVSVYDGGEIKWFGHPKDFDWNSLNGMTLLAHNASFDELVFRRLREQGIVPASCQPAGWLCTADLAAYLRVKRDLATASKILLGRTMNKATRDKMKGKTRAEAIAAGMGTELDEYVSTDAINCFDLFAQHGHKWPECEREYSQRLRESQWRGLPVDLPKAKAALDELVARTHHIVRDIPWADEGPILSPKLLRIEGRKCGIPVPASLSKTDAAAMEWFEEYAPKFPWIAAVRDYRSINSHTSKIRAIVEGTRADGRLPLSIKYFGAHSGRTSAGSTDDTGGSFNPLNMNRKALFGVDMRSLFAAPAGKTLIVADFTSIEAVMLPWIAGDNEGVRRTKESGSPYVAFAIQAGWVPEGASKESMDKETYQFAKMCVLLCGYQGGPKKFRQAAKVMFGVEMTLEKATELVTQWRAANTPIVDFWNEHNTILRWSANHNDATHEVALKSGRDLVYYEPRWHKDPERKYAEVKASVVRGIPPSKLYGGILTENCLTADTQILTPSGWKYITELGRFETLHDGQEFVSHGPVVAKGNQRVLRLAGVGITPEHLVYTERGWVAANDCRGIEEVRRGLAAVTGAVSSDKGLDGTCDWGGHHTDAESCGHVGGDDMEHSLRVRQVVSEEGQGPVEGGIRARGGLLRKAMSRISEAFHAQNDGPSGVCGVSLAACAVREPEASSVRELRRSRYHCVLALASRLRALLGGYGAELRAGIEHRTRGQQLGVLPGELPVGDQGRAVAQPEEQCNYRNAARTDAPVRGLPGIRDRLHDATEQDQAGVAFGSAVSSAGRETALVYDVVDAGPRHRFVVRSAGGPPILVHNCTQATARDVLRDARNAVERAGHDVILDVYDELVVLAPEDEAADRAKDISRLMTTSSPWAEGCPLGVEYQISKFYKK
jgi:DNA polymerase